MSMNILDVIPVGARTFDRLDGGTTWIVWSREAVEENISPTVARNKTTQQVVDISADGKAKARVRSWTGYHWIGEGPSSDVCVYCGHDNGYHSESRYGFDCGSCGSN
jgi:hypothetical protein